MRRTRLQSHATPRRVATTRTAIRMIAAKRHIAILMVTCSFTSGMRAAYAHSRHAVADRAQAQRAEGAREAGEPSQRGRRPGGPQGGQGERSSDTLEPRKNGRLHAENQRLHN